MYQKMLARLQDMLWIIEPLILETPARKSLASVRPLHSEAPGLAKTTVFALALKEPLWLPSNYHRRPATLGSIDDS